MKHETTLFLECRGCYFFNGDKINALSDVGNYRVGAYDRRISAKDGREYILEFGSYTRREMRYTNKRTGAPLKHPKYEIVLENALHVDTEFEDDQKMTWRNSKLEKEYNDKKRTYTRENILKTVNEISVKQYDRIVLVSAEEIISRLSAIYTHGGWRERDIINNLYEVKTKSYSKDYWVFEFIAADGSTFEYEYNSNLITG